MDEPAIVPAQVGPKNTFGSLVAAGFVGALVAVTLLYMWGANIAKERALEVLKPSAGLEQ